MARIETYTSDTQITADDRVIGSDADNNNQTKNYAMSDIATYVASTLDGFSQVLSNYSFLGASTTETEGYFLQPNPTTLVFAAVDRQGNNNSAFFQELTDSLSNIVFGVVRSMNDFNYFTVSSIVDNTSSFTLTVATLGNLSTGPFVEENIYSAGITPSLSGGGSATPNLQAVTEEGNTTDQPIIIDTTNGLSTLQFDDATNQIGKNNRGDLLITSSGATQITAAGGGANALFNSTGFTFSNASGTNVLVQAGAQTSLRSTSPFPGSTTSNLNLPYTGTWTFPAGQTGTVALLSDIPSTANFVTLNTAQTITAQKTFNGATTFNTIGVAPNTVDVIGNSPYIQLAQSTLTQVNRADRGAIFLNTDGNFQFFTPDDAADKSNFVISNALLTDTGVTRRVYNLPNKDGTFAMLDDIPSGSGPTLTRQKTTIDASQITDGDTVDLTLTPIGNSYIKILSLMVRYGDFGDSAYDGGGNLNFEFGGVIYNNGIPFSSVPGIAYSLETSNSVFPLISGVPLSFRPSVTPNTGDASIVISVDYVVADLS